jgi:hypothetical protein
MNDVVWNLSDVGMFLYANATRGPVKQVAGIFPGDTRPESGPD